MKQLTIYHRLKGALFASVFAIFPGLGFVKPAPSNAGDVVIPGAECLPNEPGRGGEVEEKGPPGTQFDLFLTDWQGQKLNPQPPGYPKRLVAGNNGVVRFDVPPGMPGVCDAVNETILPPVGGGGNGGGAGANLWIESIYCVRDIVPRECVLYDIFETIEFYDFTSVKIPDLYADTDGNGEIGLGDVLYSLVDLNGYLPNSIPNFSIGDTFTVVNGQVSELPFMFFSTTEFVFDENTGFTGTPYDGQAIVRTEHDFRLSIPEPSSTLSLLSLGILGAGVTLKRKVKRTHSLKK